jgi:hypothetical protein
VRLPAAAVLLVALAATPAAADRIYDLGTEAPVPGHKTWRDLLGQLFPDLRQEPRKDGKTGDCSGGDPLEIEYLEYAYAEISKKERLMVGVTTDHDACFGAVALIDGWDGKLLDAVNIQQDQNYGYGDHFVRSLGRDGQLVVADSFHTTTSNSPENYVLVLATVDKLSLIGNVEAQSEWDCEHHRGIGEQPYVVVTPDYGPFDRITGYIKRTVQPVAADCRTATGKPAVTITRTDWRWDAARKAYRRAGS